MNIGQRIWQKVQNQAPIDQEIKEIENIIDQIDPEERLIKDIDLNSGDVYNCLEEYVRIVDEKLFDIQKKYFEPNGLRLGISVNKTYLCDNSFIGVNSQNDEYEFVDDLSREFESKIYPNLLAAANISPLGLMLGSLWHVYCHEDDRFKIIRTNRDT